MATIKSYTDISQSKRLAKILPIESADMKILPFTEREYRIVPINDIAVCGREDEIYAWSLAALLGVLPQSVRLVGTPKDSYWYCEGVDNNNQWHADSASANNPIDACYEMIIKLHELNLL